ncbi:MAG: Na/Pi cotransporter family protein [Clostridia bacterium]|nr:Na/Pi cotransporter family protein [Clostridia bacterium]
MIMGLLGGVGAFLFGVKLMSDSVENLADRGMKKMFGKIGNNRLVGVGVGTAVTALIQSSSVTTVMVVGFVNAGMFTLLQATTIIMGANIGTTITAQIAALSFAGGTISVSAVAVVLTFVGIMMVMLSKRDKVRSIGTLLGGLGLIFIGLGLMSTSMSGMADSVARLIRVVTNPFILLLIGLLATALLQSSSAVTAIILVLAGEGVFVGNTTLFLIIGTNIGTCITALLSSIGTNSNARRAAIIHLMFNVLGAIIFFIPLLFWKSFMQVTFARWFSAPQTQIAMFHTFFNVFCTCVFLPVSQMFVKLANWVINDRPDASQTQLSYIDDRFLSTPSIALTQAVKEISRMSDVAMRGVDIAVNAFMNRDNSNNHQVQYMYQQVSAYNDRITIYLVKVSSNLDVVEGEKEVTSLHGVLSDIMRVSDLSLNIARYVDRVLEKDLVLTDSVNVEVAQLYQEIVKMYELTMRTLSTRNHNLLAQVDCVEDKVDQLRKQFSLNHIRRLNDGECNPQSGGLYNNLLSNLERIADHICFVAHSIEEY